MALSISTCAAVLAVSLSAPQTAAPVRVLVVTGGHTYPTSFYTVFDQPGIAWDHAVSSEEAYRTDLRERYDVLVLHDMPKALGETGRQHLRAFAEAGKGIVVVHHAIVSHPDWDWYRDLIGARYLEQPQGGRPASTYRHDEQMRIAVTGTHPVTAGPGDLHGARRDLQRHVAGADQHGPAHDGQPHRRSPGGVGQRLPAVARGHDSTRPRPRVAPRRVVQAC